jgi:anhydro-N-acetylmuramic acid kinase
MDEKKGWRQPSTLQIGESCVIAERTGVLTVADFRVRDVAAGGTGAPLIPYVDRVLAEMQIKSDNDHSSNGAGHIAQCTVFQNIGGISNCSCVTPDGSIIAFDSGPGNMVMDAIIRRWNQKLLSGDQLAQAKGYDAGGAIAAVGTVLPGLLKSSLEHWYFALGLPKCTGHEHFGDEYVNDFIRKGTIESQQVYGEHVDPLCHLMRTALSLTAITIVDAYKRFLPPIGRVVVSGGGAANHVLMAEIQMECDRLLTKASSASNDGVRVMSSDDGIGIPSDAKEAIGFALLGYATLHSQPSNVTTVTNAIGPRVLGKIVPGGDDAALRLSVSFA